MLVIFAGIPLWWVLGLFQVIFFVMAVPMLIHLLRRREVLVPQGFGIWLLFLVWLLGGFFVLQVDAPGAVPGTSMARYATFSYRWGWYVVATIALLYAVNTRRMMTAQRISNAIALMFLALIGGGLLGMLVPTLEFPSVLEVVLPRSIASNGFVQSLIHPQVAQIQDFLGYIEPRPSAPFAFANQWGIAVALTIPHFIASWWTHGGWRRSLMPLVLILAIFPIVSSLNRGMWGSLVILLVYVVTRSALSGRVGMLVLLVIGLAAAAVAIAASPLGDLIQDRINTPHSNQGRMNLSSAAVMSTYEGSPIIGFGTTRDVQGNFNSIAGGATAMCPKCSPPPLGTQGQLWQVIFGAGFVGMVLYVGFFLGQLVRGLRTRSPYAVAAQCTIIVMLVTMFVYNAVHPAIFVALVAVGILAREGDALSSRTFSDLVLPVRRTLPLILLLGLLGAVVGGGVQAVVGAPTAATQSVVIPMNNFSSVESVRAFSMDSEAALARSGPVLEEMARATGADVRAVERGLVLTADPSTRILNLTYSDEDPDVAAAGALAGAQAFLALREDMVIEVRARETASLEAQHESIVDALSIASGAGSGALATTELDLRNRSQDIAASMARVGSEQIRIGEPLGEVQLTRSRDGWFIKGGSGFMIGLLVGLLLAGPVDGRLTTLRRRTETPLSDELPVVARVRSGTEQELGRSGAMTAAGVAVGSYLPLCGILAEPTSVPAIRLAERLERQMSDTVHYGGRRVLLVASTRSRPRPVRWLYRRCQEKGLDPVGLILLEE